MRRWKRITAVYICLFLLLFVLGGCTSFAMRTPARGNENAILSRLAKTPIQYSTDGAGGSNLEFEENGYKNLVGSYNDDIVAVLIANLANPAPTTSILNEGEPVPLGYVCFDVLCMVLEPTGDWLSECGDDGLWACVRKDYFIPIENKEWNPSVAAAAQKHWQILYDTGKLKVNRQYFN